MNEILEKGWTYTELWRGCILTSIAHAIFIAEAPELAYEHSWDGVNYSTINGEGSRGTITFQKNFFVGAFRNDEFPFEVNSDKRYFSSAPPLVAEMAEKEALQYLLEEIDGELIPVITTAFWGEKGQAFSSHSFKEMMLRGGDLLAIQTLDEKSAIKACEEYYELTAEQLSLLKKLYRLKVLQPEKRIFLSPSERKVIGTSNKEGISESIISFKEIGIEWVEH